ncbi:Protein Flattop [Clonorchis sinensis]|uniref:Cilia- and flagella-associated protein 126 n=2 Tax=Clonorchis sinensis TaxID=79923 RepID=A0A8T1LYU2_CLOSI|nr:Protein Flattop [Clonorchis sinensis]
MSKNYSANQYEGPFWPDRMQLYGPTKKTNEHPKTRTRTTHIIANDQGHLLPNQKTAPGDCPWGNYVGTWDLPCHLYGYKVYNPCARSKEGMEYLQHKKELVDAAIDLAKANKCESVKKRFDEEMKN